MRRALFIINLMRVATVALFISLCVLVFGPFQGMEAQFGLSDKQAHVLGFFALTTLLLTALPRFRRLDVAILCLVFGALIEVVQGFTGRSASLGDWLADALGVSLAIIPMYVQTLRSSAQQENSRFSRRHTDVTGRRPRRAKVT
jgi:VanZ family protein